jgi:hypothetical protein
MWSAKLDAAAIIKAAGNDKLMECSARYNSLMKELREERSRD